MPDDLAASQPGFASFADKRALVVGGSSGIGNGIARALAAAGADVHVWGTRPHASDYAGVDGSDLTGVAYSPIDVADNEAIENAARAFATLDILVMSQGAVVYGRGEFKKDGWDKVMAINLDSVMDCCRAFKAQLVARQGAIIIVSSISAFRAAKGNPAYAASKAAAVSLTQTLGQAWAAEGVRVNGIAPGFVETKLTKVTTDSPLRRAAALATIPAGRFGTPQDIANAALFLASPLASYIVGHTLIVDGGATL